MYRFVDEYFPLLVGMSPRHMDEASVQSLIDGFEEYFRRGERYAFIAHTTGFDVPGARERKRLAEWSNSPEVRKLSSKLCVGSAVVVPNTLTRGALTAILWLWNPPLPLTSVATLELGCEWCFDRLDATGLVLPASRFEVRKGLVRRVHELAA
jgi:hypothetical protein